MKDFFFILFKSVLVTISYFLLCYLFIVLQDVIGYTDLTTDTDAPFLFLIFYGAIGVFTILKKLK